MITIFRKRGCATRSDAMMARALSLIPALLLLSSCSRGDEELQRQIIELRAAVEAKNKAVVQLESQMSNMQTQRPAPAAPAPSSASSEELAKAKARIAELEQSLAAAQAAASSAGNTPQIGKLDMDAVAGRLEEDLTRKAKQLRELVQRQSPSSRIDEISLKSIEYPPQLVTPFTSAITFTLTEGNNTPMRLMFPVTADLGGSWKLPTPDEVHKAYAAARNQPAGGYAASTPAPAPSAPSQAPPQSATTASSGGPRMTQRADGVFVFDWGDSPSGARPAQPQPGYNQAPPPGAPQAVSNFVPPGQAGAAPRTQAPPAPQAPAVPPPVMPIVGDRVIRFND